LLLASYGIRRGQIVTLELGDVDWRGRMIAFRAHKGGKPVQQTLTAAVAESLSRYLRHERPQSDSPKVFLRSRPPHLPLGPSAVSALVRAHLLRLGLGQPNLRARGPHALRHAFVARLLRAGQPLKVIADLLGHRSLSAVAHYAKVDHPRLLEVAGDWPEVHS
jgi:integrase